MDSGITEYTYLINESNRYPKIAIVSINALFTFNRPHYALVFVEGLSYLSDFL